QVFVNDKKFACESCIKGHRSSGCQHADRPLFEVKKKGRPVSQCEKCRELRKTKRMHGKCNCASTSAAGSSAEGKLVDGSATKVKGTSVSEPWPASPLDVSRSSEIQADCSCVAEWLEGRRYPRCRRPCNRLSEPVSMPREGCYYMHM
ncbi:copper fist DNA binding domain-containing protein, partial [Cerioporus squamosus]